MCNEETGTRVAILINTRQFISFIPLSDALKFNLTNTTRAALAELHALKPSDHSSSCRRQARRSGQRMLCYP